MPRTVFTYKMVFAGAVARGRRGTGRAQVQGAIVFKEVWDWEEREVWGQRTSGGRCRERRVAWAMKVTQGGVLRQQMAAGGRGCAPLATECSRWERGSVIQTEGLSTDSPPRSRAAPLPLGWLGRQGICTHSKSLFKRISGRSLLFGKLIVSDVACNSWRGRPAATLGGTGQTGSMKMIW